jgi:hypothetical protein
MTAHRTASQAMTFVHIEHLEIAHQIKPVSLLGVLADQLFVDVFLRVVSIICYEKMGTSIKL